MYINVTYTARETPLVVRGFAASSSFIKLLPAYCSFVSFYMIFSVSRGYAGRRRRDVNNDIAGSDDIKIFDTVKEVGGDVIHVADTTEEEAEEERRVMSHEPEVEV